MSRTQSPPLSVEEVLELQPESWINAGLRGLVLFVETIAKKAGGNFWKITLGSETSSAQVKMSMFTAPKFKPKDVIEITGQGTKVTEYQGENQVTLGRAAEIHIITSAPAQQRQAPPANRPAQDDSRGAPASPPPAEDPADKSPHGANPIPGQEVGMALKEALMLVRESYGSGFIPDTLDLPIFWRRVHVAASDVLRVSTMLRRGTIAPNVIERNRPAEEPPPGANQAPARQAPPPERQAPAESRQTPPARNVTPPRASQTPEDEDVPF